MKLLQSIKIFFFVVLLLVINIVGLVFVRSISNLQPAYYNQEILQEPFQEYRLSPLYSHQIVANSELPFLYVNTSPTSLKYYFTWLKEDWSLKNKSFEYLFLASKRISELSRWGRELYVTGTFVDIKSFRQFQYDARPRVWKLMFNNFNSWESTLARFMGFMDLEVNKIEQEKNIYSKIEKLGALQNFTVAFEREVATTLFKLDKNDDEKQYLQYMAQQIFDFYKDYIDKQLPPYDPRNIDYVITDITTDKNMGIYDIQIDSYDQPLPGNDGYILQYNNKDYSNFVKPNDALSPPFTYSQTLFKDILITEHSDKLTLKLPVLAINSIPVWHQRKNDEHEYVYYQDLVIKRPNQRFFLNFDYQFSVPVTFQFAMVTTSEEFDARNRKRKITHEDKFANIVFPPSSKPENFTKHIDLYNQKEDVLTRIIIISKTPLTESELQESRITLTPVFEPVINFERINYVPHKKPSISYIKTRNNQYKIQLTNTSRIQEADIVKNLGLGWTVIATNDHGISIEFWPANAITWSLIFFDFCVLFLILKRTLIAHIARHALTTTKQYISKMQAFDLLLVKNTLYNGLAKGVTFRLYILLASMANILFYIFIVKRDQNDMLPYSLVLWIIATAVYRVKSYVHFVFGLMLLVCTVAAFILQFDALSEKAAIWAYFFFAVGTMQAFIEFMLKPTHTLTLSELIDRLSSDTKLLSNFLQQVFRVIIFPIYVALKKIILDAYGPSPKTRKDKIVLSTKIGITVIIITIVMVILITVERHHTRSTFNPYITYLAPTLVYPSTVVIIKGENFGWKQQEKVRLKYVGGEILTSFWTDSKIIFTVPLHWKPGEVDIWIEKPTQWEGKIIRAKSKLQKIKVLPRGTAFTPDDDAFFQQIKKLDFEVRKINGYE